MKNIEKVYIVNNGTSYAKELIKTLEKKSKYQIIDIFYKRSVLDKIFFRLGNILKKDLSKFWMKKTLQCFKDLNENTSIIIIFDSGLGSHKINEIRKKYPNTKIVFWYWNRVKEEFIENIRSKADLVVTYDRVESIKYGIKFIPQFYIKEIEFSNENFIYDIIFIGFNRGRLKILKNISEKFRLNNLKSKFYVIDEKNEAKDNFLETKILMYEEVLDMTKKSKAILEINQKNQNGLSLRALEAMLMNKKLLTNNEDIVNYDFYHPSNIQILNDINNIDYDFFNLPVEKNFFEKARDYSAESWLKKIVELLNN